MFGFGKPRPVAEYQAKGAIKRVYHEIKHTLRVTGINLNFRTWAGYGTFLPAMWDMVRTNTETRAFENAADRLRAEAVHAADGLGRLDILATARLGESQAYHVRGALDLYHYINPKLLVLTSAVWLALHDEPLGSTGAAAAPVEFIQRGPPSTMHALDMVADKPDDRRLRALFEDIKETLALSAINSDYRTLGLWPEYLEAAWTQLKPIVQRQAYVQAAADLRQRARTLARALPYPVPLSCRQVEACTLRTTCR